MRQELATPQFPGRPSGGLSYRGCLSFLRNIPFSRGGGRSGQDFSLLTGSDCGRGPLSECRIDKGPFPTFLRLRSPPSGTGVSRRHPAPGRHRTLTRPPFGLRRWAFRRPVVPPRRPRETGKGLGRRGKHSTTCASRPSRGLRQSLHHYSNWFPDRSWPSVPGVNENVGIPDTSIFGTVVSSDRKPQPGVCGHFPVPA